MNKDRISEKIQKLLNLASNNPSEAEARAAYLKAQEVMMKYHVDNPDTVENDEVATIFYDLGVRRKTEFMLLLSVVVAQNFRSKTAHHLQRIYFFGFKPDAEAAREVYAFLLKYADSSHADYFKGRIAARQEDIDWHYGFIVGLYIAFHSRKGYELMNKVPEKVERHFATIEKTKYVDPGDTVKKLDGAFANGFTKGYRSMNKTKIEAAC